MWVASAAVVHAAPKFYPGVAEGQSMMAHEALRAYYNGNPSRAERLLRTMDALEDRDSLPPLSRLLQTAMIGLTLQRDDGGGPEASARLRARLDSAADKGLQRCRERAGRAEPAGDPTCLVIEGGIRGFRAILKLNSSSPTEVLSEGLDAVELLEKALALDSSVRDAHMGLGIFNAMAAANTPRVVRGMLRAAGRGVSTEAGLEHLRRSGYEGQYTSVASQFYLIRFLSPYDDELRREKTEIFRALRETFPLSPHTLFLQGHEALCFYPDSFYGPRARTSLARRIRSVEARDYAGTRYLNLVKHQYALLDPDPARQYAADTAFDLGGYSFYPAFIAALRLRREVLEADRTIGGAGVPDSVRADKIKRLSAMRKTLTARVRKADLSPQNRGYLEWHVRDALRPEQFARQELREGREARDARGSRSDSTVSTSKAAGKSRKPPDR
jgi:hypothetical protein